MLVTQALTFIREFVLGSNPNGTIVNNSTVGVSHPLVNDVLPGEHNPIFTGSGTTLGSTLWPSATVAAWDSFIATATVVSTQATQGKSGAVSHHATIGITVAIAGLSVMLLA